MGLNGLRLSVEINPGRESGLFPVDEPEDQRQQEADQQAGGEGEVKGHILSAKIEVPRQSADPGDFPCQQKQKADPRQERPGDDQDASQRRKIDRSVPSLR